MGEFFEKKLPQKERVRVNDRLSLLRLFEEGKSITLKELLKKRRVGEMNGLRKIKEMNKLKETINDCKERELITEIGKNVFQVNQESLSFKTLKKFLEKENERNKKNFN